MMKLRIVHEAQDIDNQQSESIPLELRIFDPIHARSWLKVTT